MILDRPGAEVTEQTRTIAVWITNSEQVEHTDWRDYIVSVDEVERRTGYNFFATVPRRVQKIVEKI